MVFTTFTLPSGICCQMSYDAALIRPFSPKLSGPVAPIEVYLLSAEDRLDGLVQLREVVIGTRIVRHRAHVPRELQRISRARFKRGEKRDEGAVEGFRKKRLEVHAWLRAVLKQRLECWKRRTRRRICLRCAHARIVLAPPPGAVVQCIGAKALPRVPFASADQRQREFLKRVAEIDEQPAVGVAVDKLLCLAVEGRLRLIVVDEFGDRAAGLRPGVLEHGGEIRTVRVVACTHVDLRARAEGIADHLDEHAALQIIGGDRLPYQRRRTGVEPCQRRAGAAGENRHLIRNGDGCGDGRGDGAVKVANDDVDVVDLHQFLCRLDAGLWVTLAVLRIRKQDLNGVQPHRFQSLRDGLNAKPRCLIPALPAWRGVTGEARENAVTQGEGRRICDRRRSGRHNAGEDRKAYPHIPRHAFLPACDDMCS
jgi:hypothetical protein